MVCVMLAYVASVSSMRVGELSFVSPFRYASLLFAIVLGAAVFGTVPDALTVVGAGIVVASGLATLLGERGRGAAREGTRPAE
jgi:drug/metabolite transporter (DMT)-like permease